MWSKAKRKTIQRRFRNDKNEETSKAVEVTVATAFRYLKENNEKNWSSEKEPDNTSGDEKYSIW